MKLISMTDFVLSQSEGSTIDWEQLDWMNQEIYKLDRIRNYANFLKQPLELYMFVPCDEDGNVLDAEPCSLGMFLKGNPFFDVYLESKNKWDEAKERCLFKGFSEKDAKIALFANETIEDLIEFNLTLTQIAIKQIGL